MVDSSSIKTISLVTILIAFAFSLAAVIVSAIDYDVLDVDWNNSPWRHLGVLQIASTIFATVISLIGILINIICFQEKSILGLVILFYFNFQYIVLLIVSALFSIAIGIFNSIGGVIYHKSNHLIGCDTELTGILKLWENIDEYLILAHSVVCSPLCKCEVKPSVKTQMKINFFTKETYEHISQYMTDGDEDSDVSFSINNCPSSVLEAIQEIYQSNPNNTHTRIKNFKKFNNYWKQIEKRFKCSGWCRTKYTNPYTSQNDTMIKYIFRNINKGVVEYPGCLNRLINWIPSMVAVVGALLISCGVIQIVHMFITMKIMNDS